MTEVNHARKRENTRITLTNTPDDICRCCPNLKDDICENCKQNERIVHMDNEVLSEKDWTHLRTMIAIDLFKKVENIFNSKRKGA